MGPCPKSKDQFRASCWQILSKYLERLVDILRMDQVMCLAEIGGIGWYDFRSHKVGPDPTHRFFLRISW